MRQLAFTVTDQYTFQVPLEGMQPISRQTHVVRRTSHIELGKHHLHTVTQIGSDKATVVPLVEAFETTMSEAPYHVYTVKCLWSLVNPDKLRHRFSFVDA